MENRTWGLWAPVPGAPEITLYKEVRHRITDEPMNVFAETKAIPDYDPRERRPLLRLRRSHHRGQYIFCGSPFLRKRIARAGVHQEYQGGRHSSQVISGGCTYSRQNWWQAGTKNGAYRHDNQGKRR